MQALSNAVPCLNMDGFRLFTVPIDERFHLLQKSSLVDPTLFALFQRILNIVYTG